MFVKKHVNLWQFVSHTWGFSQKKAKILIAFNISKMSGCEDARLEYDFIPFHLYIWVNIRYNNPVISENSKYQTVLKNNF